MIEKIGQTILDTTYYSKIYDDAEDDGLDEMLETARSCPEEDWNHMIAERRDPSILYQFSHLRENILSWLPFSGTERVLEIGAGCGAVTGVLCRNAEEVTCVEISEKCSRINAWRHRAHGNLRIMTGRFCDIEKNLTEKFDYITMIDVLEYAQKHVQSDAPYAELLKMAVRHLKPEGKLILSMENRLGLKYWAGSPEETSGKLFEGLEGYPTTKKGRTFSRKELAEILRQAGEFHTEWYYPFPDHKLPMTIYSDRRLPVKGELNRLETDYDRLRMQLFQESPVYDSLISNTMYPEFANSFLVLLSPQKTDTDTTYVKFSNERDPQFSIRTEIIRNPAGELLVRKLPSGSRSADHIKNLEKICKEMLPLYAQEGLELNRCSLENDCAYLEYLEGETLEEYLDQLLEQGRIRELEEVFFTYIEKIRRIHSTDDFRMTPEFQHVFGEQEIMEGSRCGAMSNIDLVPANILLGEEKTTVIDYEWTFRFPVPCGFILYRMIHYYLESDGKRRILKTLDLYEKAGIAEDDRRVYEAMEQSFQSFMKGKHIPVLSLYDAIAPGKADVISVYEQIRSENSERDLQVFYDRGEDFCEKDSDVFQMKKNPIRISLPEKVRRLRLDPGEAPGGLILKKLAYTDDRKAVFTTNGFPLGNDRYYFGAGDPQFIIEEIPEDAQAVEMEIEVIREQEARKEFWEKFAAVSSQKDQEIQRLKQQIRAMENTKVWKLYQSIRKK